MFASNSHYETNLKNVFNYLASNASNPNGFYQAVSSSSKTSTIDTVYGLFVCRGDLNASSCQDCVTTATTIDLPETYCPNRKVAVIWYEECMVRYSNQSFFGKLDEDPGWFMVNSNNITGNITRFEQLLWNMLTNVVAVRAAAGGSKMKFATDAAKFTSSQTIYGMGQCTPDLSPHDCNTCLKKNIMQLKVSQGARILQASCIVRYELYPFFNLSSLSIPPEGLSPSLQPVSGPSSQGSSPEASPPPVPETLPPSPQLSPSVESSPPPGPPPQVLSPSPHLLAPSGSTHSSDAAKTGTNARSPDASPSATTALTPYLNTFCAVGILVVISLFHPNYLAL